MPVLVGALIVLGYTLGCALVAHVRYRTPSNRARNAALVAALVAATIAATPAITLGVPDARFERKVDYAQAARLRVVLDQWEHTE